jgi:ribonuclease BN (tRNA processing enzyme)
MPIAVQARRESSWMRRAGSCRLAAVAILACLAGVTLMPAPEPAGEGPYLQSLGTKAGTEYQEYAPTEPQSIFGYAMLYVPPNAVIDFAQDARDKIRHWGVAEEDIDNILFTHSHFDHYDPPTVLSFARDRWREFGRKTHAFASETVFADLTRASAEAQAEGFLTITKVTPGNRIDLAEGVAAVALPSSHWTAPTPVQFLLEFHGKEVLYAPDSAAFREEDFAALQGHRLDAVIIDCTYLDDEVDPEKSGHMNYSMVCEQMAELRERGSATESTLCFITHLVASDYHLVASAARDLGLITAHDGLRIVLP